MAHDLLRWREEFPILATSTYLVSHSMGAMPRRAADSLRAYIEAWNHDGIAAWEKWIAFMDDTAGLVGRFLGAEPQTIVFHQNVSALFNAVLSCFDWNGPRREILYPELTFPTLKYNIHTRTRLGAVAVEVPSPDGIRQPAEGFVRRISERTALVVVDHGIYRSGALVEIEPTVAAARAHGALVVVDAYQTVGVMPLDVRRWGADFVLGGSHKWLCGGAGAAFLYIRPDRIEWARPRITGWFSQENVFAFSDRIEYARGPRRFLGGTPGIAAIHAARAGYEILLEAGLERIRARNLELTERIIAGADARGWTVRTPRRPEERGGWICVDFPGAERVEPELVRRRFFCDFRPKAGIRLGPHFYNRDDEVDAMLDEMDRVRKEVT
jgi:kynureninase